MPARTPDGWRRVRLGGVATVARGTGPRYAAGTGAVVLSQKCIQSSGIELRWAKEVDPEWVSTRSPRHLIQAGDVLVNSTGEGTLGRSAFASEPVVGLPFDSHVLAVRTDRDQAHPEWVAQYLRSRQGAAALQRLKGAKTTNQTELGASRVAELDLLLPPLPEQRAIAAVLGDVDDTIERTKAVIAATDELRRALLHDLLTRGVPGWHSEWKHVPSLGTVPACWEVVRLGDEATVRNGTTPSRSRPEYWAGGDVPFVKTGRVNDIRIDEPDEFITSKAVREAGAVLVPAGAVLIAMIGQGKTRGMAARLGFDAAINQNFAAVYRTSPDLDLDFLFVWARQNYSSLRALGQGTNQDALNCELIEGLRLPHPPEAEQRTIAETAAVIAERQHAELGTLSELRDAKAALADALLTGRVRVSLATGSPQ